MEATIEMQRVWDMNFIENETKVVDDLCRKIVYSIDQANSISPQYLCECDEQRLLVDKAIGYCNNLKRELNHIAEMIPCNKNYLVIQTEDIEKEIGYLKGWRKTFNGYRDKVIKNEIERRSNIYEKTSFVKMSDVE